jgi:hypothetical protein
LREYIDKLINGPVEAIVRAHAAARFATLEFGSATQATPVSFNRRSVMRDGSVQTWQSYENPNVVRAAGPIDPQIALLTVRDDAGKLCGILSNFALHLDTVGGMKWSADYPFFIEQTLRKASGSDVISIFGTGCCGDINHVNPRSKDRIRRTLSAIRSANRFTGNATIEAPRRRIWSKSQVVHCRCKRDEGRGHPASRSSRRPTQRKSTLEHVTAYKKLVLDQLRHREPHAVAVEHITWGLSRSLAGVGETLPVDVTVMTLGRDVAIVCLPGEIFVVGLASSKARPLAQPWSSNSRTPSRPSTSRTALPT